MVENKEKEPKSGGKGLMIALAVTNLLSLGALGWFVLVRGGDDAAAQTPLQPAEQPGQPVPAGPTVALGNFSITLADPGQNRYLKAVLKARVNGPEVSTELQDREPEIRDRVIDYLSSLTVKETQGAAAKQTIRANLEKRINNILRTGEVESIFLTEFVTQ